MDLYSKLIEAIPELTDNDFSPNNGSILLKDDGDGVQYISKWDYPAPLPKGFTLGKEAQSL
jgi:hypothetical protein